MRKSSIAVFTLTALWLALSTAAFCSDVTGEVVGPNGPVAGAQVTLTDANGAVAGQGTTNDAGKYCITGVNPGDYKTACTPPTATGFHPGANNRSVPEQGLTEDWSLSPTTVASSSANTPGVCEPWYLGGAALGTAALLVATGAGLGACAGAGCFDGAHNATPSK
jgi:Carboxypeptidase regulatory-like domain